VEVVKDQTDWRYGKGLGFAVLLKHPAELNTWKQKPFYLGLLAAVLHWPIADRPVGTVVAGAPSDAGD